MSVATGPALAACHIAILAQLPVTMTGLRPTVTADINGAQAVFTVDSGSFFSMLSPAAASQLRLRLQPAPPRLNVGGIGGQIIRYSVATVDHFGLGPFNLRNVDFIVGGNDFGAGAQGLLGQNLLRVGDVEYDLANGVIRLMKPSDCGRTALVYWDRSHPYSSMPIQSTSAMDPYTRGTAWLNGKKISVLFDTGSPLSMLSLRAAERAGVHPGDPGVEPNGYLFGIGQRGVHSWIAPFASFRIGDEQIRNTHLRIADIGRSDIDMYIGADFFLAHHIYVASSQHRLYFTYNGGPVFNLTAYLPHRPGTPGPPGAAPGSVAPGTSKPPPADAAGFANRGAALLARGEFADALADLTRACRLDATQPRYFELRATAELRLQQPRRALADYDEAIRLKGDDVAALLARARLRLKNGDRGGALADLQAIGLAVPAQADVRFVLANLYASAEQYPPAITQYSTWLTAHAEDFKAGGALNGRCRARALADVQLHAALKDCSAALRAAQTDFERAQALGNRGLVRLRLGDYRHSLEDYNQALRLRPQSAWSLYGRGIDELRSGAGSAGSADLAAAEALQPPIRLQFSRAGISP